RERFYRLVRIDAGAEPNDELPAERLEISTAPEHGLTRVGVGGRDEVALVVQDGVAVPVSDDLGRVGRERSRLSARDPEAVGVLGVVELRVVLRRDSVVPELFL